MSVLLHFGIDQDDSNSGSEKKKKRRSRWGDTEAEKNIVTGLPVVVPQGLTKEQEEQYLRKFNWLIYVQSTTKILQPSCDVIYVVWYYTVYRAVLSGHIL